MKTSEKPKRKGARGEPTFMTKAQLAHELTIEPGTLDDWIAAGTIPPPHSQPGERTAVWLRKHFRHYVDHGRWPDEAYKFGSGGAG